MNSELQKHTNLFAKINWQELGNEAVIILQEYIRINTTNPPGNELEGASYLKKYSTRKK